VVEIPVPRV
jgi:hypothetical protein